MSTPHIRTYTEDVLIYGFTHVLYRLDLVETMHLYTLAHYCKAVKPKR